MKHKINVIILISSIHVHRKRFARQQVSLYAKIPVSNLPTIVFLFFFNATATTEIYTLSLHDALPIFRRLSWTGSPPVLRGRTRVSRDRRDRKSTRLNSSHGSISYAVFCLKKKNK